MSVTGVVETVENILLYCWGGDRSCGKYNDLLDRK